MKTLITNYSFNASAKTITFNGYTNISLDSILLITNVTDNIIIYNFADPTRGGTVTNNILTLIYDTSTAGMSNTDRLQIYYDDPAIQPANASNQSKLEDAIDAITYLAAQLQWLGQTKSYTTTSNLPPALTTVLDTRSSINTVSTVSTVSGVTTVSTLTDAGRLNNLGPSAASASNTIGRGPLDASALIQYNAASAAALATINNIVIT